MDPSYRYANQVAQTALHHYNHVLPPKKGKPRPEEEWTVYAAIVASSSTLPTENDGDASTATVTSHLNSEGHKGNSTDAMSSSSSSSWWVVSCATGTKCCCVPSATTTTGSSVNVDASNRHSVEDTAAMSVVHDSHAEVLCRRGLLRVFLNEMEVLRNTDNADDRSVQHRLLEPTTLSNSGGDDENAESQSTTFQLRQDVQLHLYVSDSPCGDASIYALESLDNLDDNVEDCSSTAKTKLQFTGAKVIVSKETNVSISDFEGKIMDAILPINSKAPTVQLAREEEQLLGKLRTKSGRSNLEYHRRSMSMSCSDKIVRWSVLGLQGALLSSLLPKPIGFTSVIVGQDPRAKAFRVGQRNDPKTTPSSQLQALDRAISKRVDHVQKCLLSELCQASPSPSTSADNCTSTEKQNSEVIQLARHISIPIVSLSMHTFPLGKAAVEYERSSDDSTQRTLDGTSRKRRRHCCNKMSPAGLSINWQQSTTSKVGNESSIELTVGARGIQNGKKPKVAADYIRRMSRLCRLALVQAPMLPSMDEFFEDSYTQYKQQHSHATYKSLRNLVFSHGPLSGWVVGNGSR